MATGENIRKLRQLCGLTLEQLSELSGVEVGTISALEIRDSARSKFFPSIAKAFGISTDELSSEISLDQISRAQIMYNQSKGDSPADWMTTTEIAQCVFDFGVKTQAGAQEVLPSSNTRPGAHAAQSAPSLISLSDHPDLVSVPRVKFKLSAGVSGYAIEPENGNGKPVFFRQDWFASNGYRPEKLFAVRVSGASMEPALWDGDLVVINTNDTTPHDGEAFAINYEGEMVIKRMRRDAGEWWATSDNSDQRRFAPKRCTEDVVIIGRVIYKQSERI